SVRDSLKIPIQRLNQSLRSQSHTDKFIDLAIALESLILHEIKDREQLSFTFRLRGAWLLGRNAKERKENFDLLKDIYNARSMAVHSGKIDAKKLKMSPQDVFDRGVNTCAKIIKEIISNCKFPDWNTLILGDKDV
ncbi:MAG: HEPN domain-containing protein, partial [Sedimentisphaerales bacterium]|nr:HEPN domain-containing protein [Sedimentisphaerales bacterium]